MGYGVVKPSLGRTMIYVRALAIAHFVFGVIYAVASLSVTPDSAGPLVLLVILPLAATLTAFYVWTLNSLNLTMKDLIDRKQKVKALMYKKLWWCILGSIMVIFGFFFINSFAFAGRSEANFVPTHWQTRWFVLDGWLNLVYLFDIAFIAYLWRPTANNRRFAMSDEVGWRLKVLRIVVLNLSRLPKMMMDSRSGRSQTRWMKKITEVQKARGHPCPMVQAAVCHPYHRSLPHRRPDRESPSMERPYSQWAKKETSGRTTMNHQEIQARGKG